VQSASITSRVFSSLLRRRWIAAAALALSAAAARAQPVEWPVAAGGNGHFYEYVLGNIAWGTAATRARQAAHLGLHGHLVSITSAEENAFVLALAGGGTFRPWIGLTDEEVEGAFQWVTGETFEFANWDQGEPNNAGTGEDFVEMFASAEWNDNDDVTAHNQGYVVEYDELLGPAGDACADAIGVGVPSFTAGSTAGAAADTRPECGVAGGGGPGVWCRFQGTGNETIVSTCRETTDFDTQVRVFTDGCETLTCVAGGEDSDCTLDLSRSTVAFSSEIGRSYLVLVEGAGGASGSFELAITQIGPPGDDCTDAVEVAVPSVTAGNTSASLTDSVPQCIVSNGAAPGLWYRLSGNGNTLEAHTCSPITNYDTQLRVYRGDCGALVCVGGNDDASPPCSLSSLRSSVTFDSIAGEDYFVLVHGFGAMSGSFELTIADLGVPPEPPANDACTGAIEVAVPSVTDGTTMAAGADGAPACPGIGGTGTGVWYRFRGTGREIVAFTCSEATAFDTVLKLYTGGCEALVCASASDDSAECGNPLHSRIVLDSEPDLEYLLLVQGFSPAALGSFQLTLEGEEPPGPGFVRGDVNGDGQVGGSVTDIIVYANWSFLGNERPPCLVAADVNGDGRVGGSVTDMVYYANWAFLGNAPPPPPFPDCGLEMPVPDVDPIGCETPPPNCP
jgi:hypothetical protein